MNKVQHLQSLTKIIVYKLRRDFLQKWVRDDEVLAQSQFEEKEAHFREKDQANYAQLFSLGTVQSQKGQMTVEAVLLIAIFVIAFTVVQRGIRDEGLIANMINGPWPMLQNMIENGVWEADKNTAESKHPNLFKRRASPRTI